MTAIPLTKEELDKIAEEEKKRKKRKEKKKKKKKKKKRKHDEDEEEDNDEDAKGTEHSNEAKEQKTDKTVKEEKGTKESKKSSKEKNAEIDSEKTQDVNNDDDDDEKASKKRRREERRAARKDLKNQVPKVDEHGIAYTKLQIRRMMKRVKRGLPPVPTEKEEQERLRQEAELRREEEAELAGMLYERDKDKFKGVDDSGEEEGDDDLDEEVAELERDGMDGMNEGEEEDNDLEKKEASITLVAAKASTKTNDKMEEEADLAPQQKKRKRSKEVPPDYVCQACKNKHKPVHWIYDCPDKVTVRGTNQVSKKQRGIQNPNANKLFVSGLPFDTKRKDVENLFRGCGKVVKLKILTFPDTGRCKGQAFLTFDTDDNAKKALQLDGSTIDNNNSEGKKDLKRKELKLKVSMMKNRAQTRRKL